MRDSGRMIAITYGAGSRTGRLQPWVAMGSARAALEAWYATERTTRMAQTVYLFVFDGLADWEPGYAIAGINSHAFQRSPGRYVMRIASVGGRSVTTAGGLRIQPDEALHAVTPAESAMLILPGGNSWDEGGNAEAIDLAGRFLAAGVPVAAICGATAGLARAGLLDDRAHTSNMPEYLAATGYAGAAHYLDQAVVADGDLITAPGTAPLDFARAIFERLDLFTPAVIDAWYGLFTTRKPEYFARLMQEVSPEGREATPKPPPDGRVDKHRTGGIEMTSAIRSQIESANKAFTAAFKRGDGAAMANLYTREGQLLPANSDVVRGTEAIREFWQRVVGMGLKDASLETIEVEAHGDTAIEVGRYRLLADAGVADQGKYLVVWKNEGGTWKLHRDIWTTSQPAAAPSVVESA